ncbi:MAG: NfeD family protein [Burkholderiaceae bacterium]|nr:NfeD family protein [Burkholderiaceae bacterium]
MDIAHATIWWVAAGLAVAVELATGTFYLLMIALGLASGALAAHLGLGGAMQVVAAAAVGSGATALWHWKRMQHPRSLPARENRDVNLDIGETVHVDGWAADDTARVTYRGAGWTARRQPGGPAETGAHRIVAVEGNWLVVAPSQAGSLLTSCTAADDTSTRSLS